MILGKTNVPLGLGDWQSYNDIYGTTNNPFDLGRTPGGSSGGSSAALAAGYGALSLGSDIGGSLRVPAFHCGVYAHKPTYALVPARGHTPPPLPPLPIDRDLSVIGPMARTRRRSVAAARRHRGSGSAGSRQGLPARAAAAAPRRVEEFSGAADRHRSGDADRQGRARARIERSPANLGKAGVNVDSHEPAIAGLRRLVAALYADADVVSAGAFTPEVYAGAQTAAAKLAPDDISLRRAAARHRAQPSRLVDGQWRPRAAAGAMARIVQDFDAVICPVMPTPAYPHDHSPTRKPRRIDIDGKDYRLSRSAGMARHRHPARPAGDRDTARPVAGRAAGRRADRRPWLEDRTPLKLAELIEREFGGFVPPPMFDD